MAAASSSAPGRGVVMLWPGVGDRATARTAEATTTRSPLTTAAEPEGATLLPRAQLVAQAHGAVRQAQLDAQPIGKARPATPAARRRRRASEGVLAEWYQRVCC